MDVKIAEKAHIHCSISTGLVSIVHSVTGFKKTGIFFVPMYNYVRYCIEDLSKALHLKRV